MMNADETQLTSKKLSYFTTASLAKTAEPIKMSCWGRLTRSK